MDIVAGAAFIAIVRCKAALIGAIAGGRRGLGDEEHSGECNSE
jgi:hypothetical protein